MRILLLLTLTFAALPAAAERTAPVVTEQHETALTAAEDAALVILSGIRVVNLDPQPGPIRPPRPFRLKSKEGEKPKKQYKATPPTFRSTIRHGFVKSTKSTINYTGRWLLIFASRVFRSEFGAALASANVPLRRARRLRTPRARMTSSER